MQSVFHRITLYGKRGKGLMSRKRILVLISEGGGGHKTAGDALSQIFSPEYEVDIVNVITQIIYPLDWLHVASFGKFTGEDLYNFMLCKGFHKALNAFASAGDKYMLANQSKIEKLFEKYLEKLEAPYDLVISTVPFVNGGIAKVLQKRKVPFLIVPINLDTSMFFLGMKQVLVQEEDKILFAFPYDDGDLRKKSLKNVTFPLQKIVVTGFPVRRECQKRYSEEETLVFRENHGMNSNKHCITLVLGASGNRQLLSYVQKLSCLRLQDFDRELEINVCVGKYEKTYQKLCRLLLGQGALLLQETDFFASIQMPNGLVFFIRKYTTALSQIMACSQLIITKTGSCSVNEAIYLGKKLLLDNTDLSLAGHLFWELFNLHFVRKQGLGDVFHDLSEMTTLIRILLKEDLGHPVVTGAFPLPDFKENIQRVVSSLLVSESLC